jgi:hypothetical protein
MLKTGLTLLLIPLASFADHQHISESNNIPKITIIADTKDECFQLQRDKSYSLKKKGLSVIEQTDCLKNERGFESEIFFI